MARDWNGLDLETEFSQLLSDDSPNFRTRVLRWINDIQRDIATRHKWGFLKVEGTKKLLPGKFEQDLEMRIANGPAVALSAGGSLSENSVYTVLVTFFEDKTGAESKAGIQSLSVTTTALNKTIAVSNIQKGIESNISRRRIYLVKDGGTPFFVGSINDNTTTSYTISTDTTSTIEPPDFGYIGSIDGALRATGLRYLTYKALDQLMLESDGNPQSGSLDRFAILDESRAFLDPKPSYASTFTENYNNSADFSFNPVDIEFINGAACLKDRTPVNSTAGASYTSSKDFNWADGSLIGTLVGGATVAAGALSVLGSDGKYATYDATSKINPIEGAIRIKYVPAYNHPSGNDIVIFEYSNGVNNRNKLRLRQDAAGAWRMDAWNSSGAQFFINTGFATTLVTAGVTYEIEFNWNFRPGSEKQELYIDGVMVGSSFSWVDSLSDDLTSITNLQIGDTTNSNASYNEIVLFDKAQHTSNYTAPSDDIEETRYAIDSPSVVLTNMINAQYLAEFEADAVVPVDSVIRYAISIDSSAKYWNGVGWIDSDLTPAQTNTLTEININAGTLIDSPTSTMALAVTLNSLTGETSPCISSYTFKYAAVLSELSFYYHRIPKTIYAELTSEPDIKVYLKEALEAGVEYKGFKYRDRAGAIGKKNVYDEILRTLISKVGTPSKSRTRVRDVMGNSDGRAL